MRPGGDAANQEHGHDRDATAAARPRARTAAPCPPGWPPARAPRTRRPRFCPAGRACVRCGLRARASATCNRDTGAPGWLPRCAGRAGPLGWPGWRSLGVLYRVSGKRRSGSIVGFVLGAVSGLFCGAYGAKLGSFRIFHGDGFGRSTEVAAFRLQAYHGDGAVEEAFGLCGWEESGCCD